MTHWHSLIAASVALAGCATDSLIDNSDITVSLPGDSKADSSCEWKPEIVDEEIGRSRGEHSTLRIDRDGFAHIVYEDHALSSRDQVEIRYATNRSGQWKTSTVSTSCRLMAAERDFQRLGTRSNNTFDLDAAGHAYVVCSTGSAVKLLDNVHGAWRETSVRTPEQAHDECRAGESVPEAYSACGFYQWTFGQHIAMRLDSHGVPHIAYTAIKEKGTSSRTDWLEYATKDASGWHYTTIGGPAQYLDMEIDGHDRVHVVGKVRLDVTYLDGLLEMTNASGTWQANNLAVSYQGSMGNFASAAVSKAGRLHAVHFNNTFYGDHPDTSGLDYVRKGNGQPVGSELKRGNTVRAWAPDVALDSDETLHVAYHDNGSLAYQTIRGDQVSTPMVIDHGSVGAHASLALGGGTIHVSYFDEAESRLKYAMWSCH